MTTPVVGYLRVMSTSDTDVVHDVLDHVRADFDQSIRRLE